ncbi:MAG: hypothetical protein WBP81_12060 [Solirubrobacteraceae bacterium]
MVDRARDHALDAELLQRVGRRAAGGLQITETDHEHKRYRQQRQKQAKGERAGEYRGS